MKEGRNKKE